MPPELSDDHVAAICRVLFNHDVRFVVIGGMAARLHDTAHATIDIDICPSTEDANLNRLAGALRDLGARLRVEGDPAGVPFDPTRTCWVTSRCGARMAGSGHTHASARSTNVALTSATSAHPRSHFTALQRRTAVPYPRLRV
jgi:hypothetical protein